MTREEFMDIVYSELHSDDDNYRANRIIDAADEYAEKQTGWIPVSERLPKAYERILVTRKMFHWANEPVEYTVGIESFSGNIDFVAWMPLPESYKASPTGAEGSDKE